MIQVWRSTFRASLRGRAYLWGLVGINLVAVGLTLLFSSNYKQTEAVFSELTKPTSMHLEVPEDLSVNYFIQAGSFLDVREAQNRVAVLQSLGLAADIREGEKQGYRMFVVMLGPMQSGKKIMLVREDLLSRGIQTIKLRQHKDGSLIAGG